MHKFYDKMGNNSLLVSYDNLNKKFVFYNMSQTLLGYFTISQLMKYFGNCKDTSLEFMPEIDLESYDIIETFIGDVSTENSVTKIRLKSHVISPFMGNIELLIKLNLGVKKFIQSKLNSYLDLSDNCNKNKKNKQIKIIQNLKEFQHLMLNHTLSIISYIYEETRDDPLRRQLRENLLKYSLDISQDITKYISEKIDQENKYLNNLRDNLYEITSIKIALNKKITNLNSNIEVQNKYIISLLSKIEVISNIKNESQNGGNNFSDDYDDYYDDQNEISSSGTVQKIIDITPNHESNSQRQESTQKREFEIPSMKELSIGSPSKSKKNSSNKIVFDSKKIEKILENENGFILDDDNNNSIFEYDNIKYLSSENEMKNNKKNNNREKSENKNLFETKHLPSEKNDKKNNNNKEKSEKKNTFETKHLSGGKDERNNKKNNKKEKSENENLFNIKHLSSEKDETNKNNKKNNKKEKSENKNLFDIKHLSSENNKKKNKKSENNLFDIKHLSSEKEKNNNKDKSEEKNPFDIKYLSTEKDKKNNDDIFESKKSINTKSDKGKKMTKSENKNKANNSETSDDNK